MMTDGVRFLTIPQSNPVSAFTMPGIIRDGGPTVEEFRDLLLFAGAGQADPGQKLLSYQSISMPKPADLALS
jgi:hypothetical protein